MKQKIAQIIQSLASIGLNEQASHLASIHNLYKIAFHDFSKEIQVLTELASIIDHLQDIQFNEYVQDDLRLPAFTIKSDKETVNKQAEPLKGYTKQQILLGIQNYLRMFTKHYMKSRRTRLTYEEEQVYEQITMALDEVASKLQEANRAVTKGISKQSIWSGLGKVLRTAATINLYIKIVQKEAPKARDRKWQFVQTPGAGSEMWLEKINKLHFNLEEEFEKIEKDFIQEHNLTEEMFYYIVRSFRSKGSMVNYKDKVNKYVNKNLKGKTTASLKKYAIDEDEDDDITEFDISEADEFIETHTSPIEEDLKKTPKEKPSEEKKKPGIFSPEALRNIFEEYGQDVKVDYRAIVHKVTSTSSLIKSYTSKGKPIYYEPGHIIQAYAQYLLPLFKGQYESLLQSALQVYTSVYQVQVVQNDLAETLRELAERLEILNEGNA